MKPVVIGVLLLGLPGVIDAHARSLEEIQPITINHGPSTNNSARIELLKKEGDKWLPMFPEVVRKQFDTTDWLYWVDFGIRLPVGAGFVLSFPCPTIGGARIDRTNREGRVRFHNREMRRGWARVRPGGLGNIEHSTLNVERRSGGRGIMWTAAIHRRFAFGLMDLPARV